jgi:hypothetical protein
MKICRGLLVAVLCMITRLCAGELLTIELYTDINCFNGETELVLDTKTVGSCFKLDRAYKAVRIDPGQGGTGDSIAFFDSVKCSNHNTGHAEAVGFNPSTVDFCIPLPFNIVAYEVASVVKRSLDSTTLKRAAPVTSGRSYRIAAGNVACTLANIVFKPLLSAGDVKMPQALIEATGREINMEWSAINVGKTLFETTVGGRTDVVTIATSSTRGALTTTNFPTAIMTIIYDRLAAGARSLGFDPASITFSLRNVASNDLIVVSSRGL